VQIGPLVTQHHIYVNKVYNILKYFMLNLYFVKTLFGRKFCRAVFEPKGNEVTGLSSRGQLTKGGPPAWGLGGGLTTPHRKKRKNVTKCYKGPRTWADALQLPKPRKMECQKSL
jgi:hypothetical protein